MNRLLAAPNVFDDLRQQLPVRHGVQNCYASFVCVLADTGFGCELLATVNRLASFRRKRQKHVSELPKGSLLAGRRLIRLRLPLQNLFPFADEHDPINVGDVAAS